MIRRDLDQVVGAAEAEIARNRAMLERFGLVARELEAAQALNADIVAGADDMLRSAREVQSGTNQIAEAADLAAAAARKAVPPRASRRRVPKRWLLPLRTSHRSRLSSSRPKPDPLPDEPVTDARTLTFRLGGETLAMAASLVQEIVPLPRLARMPHAPAA